MNGIVYHAMVTVSMGYLLFADKRPWYMSVLCALVLGSLVLTFFRMV